MRNPKTMEDVIRMCKEEGNHFFDRDTILFFGSKVETKLFDNFTFVTSDDNWNRTERMYTVRQFDPYYESMGGMIKDVSGFGEFKSLEDAVEYAKSV